MIKAQANSDFPKTKGQLIFEHILFALCLCIIALRTTVTESPNVQSGSQIDSLNDIVYSLVISGVLIVSFLFWLVLHCWSRRFLYRFSAIEFGLCLFAVAAVVAGSAASDKRAAITGIVTLLAPVLMAFLLVQILDSKAKLRLLLAVIAALGVVSAYQCSSQLFTGNKQLIEFYKEHPDEVLARQNIAPNTLKHWQFEHRLYSKDVSGFFTTSNSAGSFALLASFAGLALFLEKLKDRRAGSPLQPLVLCGIGVAVIIFGLIITRSKGATAASLIAAAMFALYLVSGNWLRAHKRLILTACLLLGLAGGAAVANYGQTHGRLPGGNSMLVRWQYWHATARMYADHPLKGVGPGNFTHYYLHYKPCAAVEEVADPHNFPLSILAQYGPIGLVGFWMMVLIPLWKVISRRPVLSSPKPDQRQPNLRKLVIPFAIAISASLLLIRPILIPIKTSGYLDATMGPAVYVIGLMYVIFVLYVAPMLAFVAGLWIFTTSQDKYKDGSLRYICAALFCAVCGFLIHNLIDFAIFEPGVATVFWAIIACLLAADLLQNPRPQSILKLAPLAKVLMTAAGALLLWACLSYALAPPVRSTAKIRQADHASSLGQINRAHRLLADAAQHDPLSPSPLSTDAELYLHQFKLFGRRDQNLLNAAEERLLEAIDRDNAHFKNFERLTEVYTSLAEISTGQEMTNWLSKALDTAEQAIKRYPGCDRLHIKRAQIAESLDKVDIAINHYQKAVKIEQEYRDQFRQMYPDEEIFSRLGEETYQFAKRRIVQLSKQTPP